MKRINPIAISVELFVTAHPYTPLGVHFNEEKMPALRYRKTTTVILSQ